MTIFFIYWIFNVACYFKQRANSLSSVLNLNNIKKKGVQGKLKFDNKYTMDPLSETIIENTPTHEEKAKCKIKISQLQNELKTVSLDWKLFRNMEECACSTTFDAFNKKVNVYYNLRFNLELELYFLPLFFSITVGHVERYYAQDAWVHTLFLQDIIHNVQCLLVSLVHRIPVFLLLVPKFIPLNTYLNL